MVGEAAGEALRQLHLQRVVVAAAGELLVSNGLIAGERPQEICRQRFEQFGTAGNASKIKVLPMSAMAKRYASGSLDPQLSLRRTAAE